MATPQELQAELARRQQGVTPDQIQAEIARRQEPQQALQPVQPEPSFLESVVGGVEGALGLGSAIIAEPIAGILGLAGAANPFAEEGIGARNVEAVREFLTFQPRTAEGQLAVQPIGEALQPLVEKLDKVKTFLGDDAFEATGSPALAALATALPEGLLEIVGAGAGRRAVTTAARRPAVSTAERAALADVRTAEEATGIRQITTDVFPPESRTGKFFQARGEEIAPTVRTAQQAERVRAIDQLFTNFDIDEAARFEPKLVQSVKDSVNAKKRAAGVLFEQSSGQLDKLGEVVINKTKVFAQKALTRQQKLGALADQGIIDDLTPFLEVPEGLTFNDIKTIRTSIGSKLQKAKNQAPVSGSGDVGLLSQLYKSLSEDMQEFAKNASPELAKKWNDADKTFTEFAIGSNKTGAKNIIRKGDSTPEVVDQLLFSKKNSDLEFLVDNLDDAGKQAAGQRILQRVLEKSTRGGQPLNPNLFIKELSNLRNQTIKFFDQDQRKGIAVLKKALEQTRRAQDAGVLPPTGVNLIGLLNIVDPRTLGPGLVQALIERPSMRNLLIKRNAAKTARQRFNIDAQLRAEADRLGLLSAAATGAVVSTLENNTEVQ